MGWRVHARLAGTGVVRSGCGVVCDGVLGSVVWFGLVVDGFEHSLSGVDIFSTAEARGQRAMASFQVGGRRITR